MTRKELGTPQGATGGAVAEGGERVGDVVDRAGVEEFSGLIHKKMLAVPKVMMIACTRPYAISAPFPSPRTPPTTIAMSSATGRPSPALDENQFRGDHRAHGDHRADRHVDALR